MHRFWVTKPPTSYGKTELCETEQQVAANPEQLRAIGEITDVLRTIIMRCVSVNGPKKSPFQLFEMHSGIASMLGLDEGCWVMLELSGYSPTVIFEDRDLAKLKRKSASSSKKPSLLCIIKWIIRPRLYC
jgi:hypothetical protein